jgi:hypothetical protein
MQYDFLRSFTCFRSTELNFWRRNAFKSMVPGGFPMPANMKILNVKACTALQIKEILLTYASDSTYGTNLCTTEEIHGNHPNGPLHSSPCNKRSTNYRKF